MKLGSTQELAISLAENNPESLNGTVILAEKQDRGRGRMNRRWISPGGGIWLSIILRPKMPAKKSPLLGFVAALAVCDTIAQKTGLKSKVKWPNDILINHKKVCGILLDIAIKGCGIEYAVIGIGINANANIRKILQYMDDYQESDVGVTSTIIFSIAADTLIRALSVRVSPTSSVTSLYSIVAKALRSTLTV